MTPQNSSVVYVDSLKDLGGSYEVIHHCTEGCTFCGGYKTNKGNHSDRRLFRYSVGGIPDRDLFCSWTCRQIYTFPDSDFTY